MTIDKHLCIHTSSQAQLNKGGSLLRHGWGLCGCISSAQKGAAGLSACVSATWPQSPLSEAPEPKPHQQTRRHIRSLKPIGPWHVCDPGHGTDLPQDRRSYGDAWEPKSASTKI